MKFYTVQKRSVWNAWKKQGYMKVLSSKDNPFIREYSWMKEQMKKRLSNYNSEELIWLWIEKPSHYKGWSHIPRKKFVLIELELDENEVVLSDFDLWSCYLNSFENESEESLKIVFELEQARRNMLEDDKNQTVQATVGIVDVNKAVSVKYFTTRYCKWA